MTTGTTRATSAEQRGDDRAAMEPRRDDGDDRRRRPRLRPATVAAMEPRRDDGDDLKRADRTDLAAALPQWSPVVTTGTTRTVLATPGTSKTAAMEPRRDDGDDDFLGRDVGSAPSAAMEPRRDDGDDPDASIRSGSITMPQWSPVVTTGTTRLPRAWPLTRLSCRNGAPS